MHPDEPDKEWNAGVGNAPLDTDTIERLSLSADVQALASLYPKAERFLERASKTMPRCDNTWLDENNASLLALRKIGIDDSKSMLATLQVAHCVHVSSKAAPANKKKLIESTEKVLKYAKVLGMLHPTTRKQIGDASR